MDHIVDCLYAQRWTCTAGAVRSLTGQPTMFWVELFLLTLVPSLVFLTFRVAVR